MGTIVHNNSLCIGHFITELAFEECIGDCCVMLEGSSHVFGAQRRSKVLTMIELRHRNSFRLLLNAAFINSKATTRNDHRVTGIIGFIISEHKSR
jgi:hypothetical protein